MQGWFVQSGNFYLDPAVEVNVSLCCVRGEVGHNVPKLEFITDSIDVVEHIGSDGAMLIGQAV